MSELVYRMLSQYNIVIVYYSVKMHSNFSSIYSFCLSNISDTGPLIENQRCSVGRKVMLKNVAEIRGLC